MYGIIVLSVYALIMIGATILFTRKADSKESFHVADRKIGLVKSSLSIAATWIWAPALFVSAEKAYSSGIPGFFWFLVPNVLCLLIFIPFAKGIRRQFPAGITLSGYMAQKYQSGKVKGIYQFQLGALAVLSTSVQLLAGSKILNMITGIPFWVLTIILAGIAFSYSQFSGIKASVTTDVVQIGIILAGCALITPWAVASSGGLHSLLHGLSGYTGDFSSLWDGNGVNVFLSFGLPTAIGLISGPFGDQSFWQRTFSIKERHIGKAFGIGAAVFALVPLSMGAVGFLAAGSGFAAADSSMVNFKFIKQMFPAWVLIPFLFMILSGLLSTVDSNLCSAASLTTDRRTKDNIKMSKLTMLGLLAVAILIANIPGLTVTYLFLFYGTLRASTLLPTILTLKGKKLSANGVFFGVLASLLVGLPIFAYGNLCDLALYKTIGSLATVLLSGIIAAAFGRWEARKCKS
jgi:Na+/proline symporter